MTGHSSKQELESAGEDADRRARASAMDAVDGETAEVRDGIVPPNVELDGAIDLLRVSAPPEVESGLAVSGTMSPEAIESVARFISDPGLIVNNAARELDAPSRSLAALELLDGPDYGAEPTDVRPPPAPPALPRSKRTSEAELSSIMLGAGVSSSGDTTERMKAIPRTHPLANSIAPGGSAASTPPSRPRRTNRVQVALGIAALLTIGVGASRFLQSRGEHHAASGMPGEDEEEPAPRREEPAPPVPARTPVVENAAPTPPATPVVQATASELTHQEPATAQGTASADAARATNAAADAPKGQGVRVAVGDLRMLERAQAEPLPAQPDRAQVIEAMNAMTERLRGCVGDEHGVADVTLTVRSAGVVSHALVEGTFAGSEKGTCIARALRTTRLPPFADPISRIEYPFSL